MKNVEKSFTVSLWTGSGYLTTPFATTASNEYEALDNVVVHLIENELHSYFLNENEYSERLAALDITEEEDEGYMYVDATMAGASMPVYILSENMRIQRHFNKDQSIVLPVF